MSDERAARRREAEALAAELGLDPGQVQQTIELLDAGNTVWFIARYRKEATGGLDDEAVARLAERLRARRSLEARRAEILRLLEAQGNLTPQLADEVAAAQTLQRLEDLYRPFRPKRRTRAAIARERGLLPLAACILHLRVPPEQRGAPNAAGLAEALLPSFTGVESVQEALAGACDIVAEWVADDPEIRERVRALARSGGELVAQALTASEGEDEAGSQAAEFDSYADFRARLSQLRPYQILAVNRGERLGFLSVRIEMDGERALQRIGAYLQAGKLLPAEACGRKGVRAGGRLAAELARLREAAVRDGFRRLLWPSLERELRSELTEKAHEHAIRVFGRNLKHLLMQPPLPPAVVMGIDPGYRAGCKVAVVSPTGELLEATTVYPHPPHNRWSEAAAALGKLVARHGVEVIAVGNGTASHETQVLVTEVIRGCPDQAVRYTVVDEAGASVYSASELARAELADLDVTLRGAVSIARRLQDPLAELVKIDPRSIGVGLYQHDVDQARLAESLDRVVEGCVNRVGVELNTASAELLRRVSGLTARQAEAIVAHRRALGRFTSRRQLLEVPGIGPKTFEQCAGFLRVQGGDEPLDATPIHPESYSVAPRLLERFPALRRAAGSARQGEPAAKVAQAPLPSQAELERAAVQWNVGLPTLKDIVEALARPGRDPREELPPPLLRTRVLRLEDVQVGMLFEGRVTNVVDFGAFVDIGLEKAGLVHISEMADAYVRDPFDLLSVGDRVRVRVISVDSRRGRIGLTLRPEQRAGASSATG